VLDCADYGVPQHRERTIIVARRDGGPVVWPAPTHTDGGGLFTRPWVTLADVVPRLRNMEWGWDRTVSGENPAPTVLSHRNPRWSCGQWWLTRPATTIACGPNVMAPGRHDPNVSGSQMLGAIRLEPDELAALQSFPPGYRFAGSKTSVCRQIGNAVPAPLARVVAAANRPTIP